MKFSSNLITKSRRKLVEQARSFLGGNFKFSLNQASSLRRMLKSHGVWGDDDGVKSFRSLVNRSSKSVRVNLVNVLKGGTVDIEFLDKGSVDRGRLFLDAPGKSKTKVKSTTGKIKMAVEKVQYSVVSGKRAQISVTKIKAGRLVDSSKRLLFDYAVRFNTEKRIKAYFRDKSLSGPGKPGKPGKSTGKPYKDTRVKVMGGSDSSDSGSGDNPYPKRIIEVVKERRDAYEKTKPKLKHPRPGRPTKQAQKLIREARRFTEKEKKMFREWEREEWAKKYGEHWKLFVINKAEKKADYGWGESIGYAWRRKQNPTKQFRKGPVVSRKDRLLIRDGA